MFTKAFTNVQCLLLLLLAACGSAATSQVPTALPISTPLPTPPEQIGPVSIQGAIELVGLPEVIEIGPEPERVWNCGNKNTIYKNPSLTTETTHVVEWEAGGSAGAGFTIGEGVIPGGVNLNAALEGKVIKSVQQAVQQTVAWNLTAGPDENMEYDLLWSEIWQVGYLNVLPFNQKAIRVRVHYLTDIQSEIKDSLDLGCPTPTAISPTMASMDIPQPPTMTSTRISESTATVEPQPSPTFISESTATPHTEVTTASYGCYGQRAGDDINVGPGAGPQQMADVNEVIAILKEPDIYEAIGNLDSFFDLSDGCIGYQYRTASPSTPAHIPSALANTRLMWGSLAWIQNNQAVEIRIVRLRCNYDNPCIYLLRDSEGFDVLHNGRGLLLNSPLSP